MQASRRPVRGVSRFWDLSRDHRRRLTAIKMLGRKGTVVKTRGFVPHPADGVPPEAPAGTIFVKAAQGGAIRSRWRGNRWPMM
jgi:hypothetical protein